MSQIVGAVCALTLAAMLTTSHAAVVDQQNLPKPHSFNTQDTLLKFQQEIVAGLTGTLTSIDLYTASAPGTFTFFINLGSGWQTDLDDFSMSIAPSASSTINIDVSSASIALTAGDHFMIGWVGEGPGTTCCGLRGTNVTDFYPAGQLYENGFATNNNDDLGFITYMNVSQVPLPAAVWLFGSGLIGLVGMARRKKA